MWDKELDFLEKKQKSMGQPADKHKAIN